MLKQLRKTLLDNYLSYLRNRLAAGCRNSRILFEELQTMGYKGATKLLTQVLGAIPELQRGYTLVHQFHTMVSHRAGRALPAWLKAVHKSGILELKRFADSLNKDYDAVYAGLTESWSQGPVEGINNRLKLIKRIMYGRAKFDLLRKRVIHAL